MLSIRQAVPIILGRAVSIINRDNFDDEPIVTHPLFLHALEIIVTGLFYNPLLTIAFLEHMGALNTFFKLWFEHLAEFRRLHDRKLGILAICAMFDVLSSVPPAIGQASPQLLVAALDMFAELPEAMKGELPLPDLLY